MNVMPKFPKGFNTAAALGWERDTSGVVITHFRKGGLFFNNVIKAESMLLEMDKKSPNCVPILNVLAHMYGRHLSDFESAIKYYTLVLDIEPDNAWARDERRKYTRYSSYD